MVNKNPFIIITSVGLFTNFLLFAVKLYVGISTNSISIYVDSLNNLADSFVCIIAMVGFFILTVKISEKYPFGLGRAEDVSSFITSAVIVLTGLAFAYTSIQRIMYPSPIWFSVKYAVIISVTAVVKLFLGLFYKYSGKKYPSPIIKSLFLDSILDFFITLSTVMSFTLTSYVGYSIDGFFGLFISIVLFISGCKACVKSLSLMLGKSDIEFNNKVKSVILDTEGVTSIVTFECHRYGQRNIVSCEVTSNLMSAQDFIDIQTRIKQNIHQAFDLDIIVSVVRGG